MKNNKQLNLFSEKTSEFNDFVPIVIQSVGNEEINTVNARDLHEFLGSKKKYTDWIIEKIERYGFKENIDYISFHKKVKRAIVSTCHFWQAISNKIGKVLL